MSPTEKAVREAAASLRDAITAAEQSGYRVTLPRHAKDLGSILISETGNVKPAEAVTPRRSKKSRPTAG